MLRVFSSKTLQAFATKTDRTSKAVDRVTLETEGRRRGNEQISTIIAVFSCDLFCLLFFAPGDKRLSVVLLF